MARSLSCTSSVSTALRWLRTHPPRACVDSSSDSSARECAPPSASLLLAHDVVSGARYVLDTDSGLLSCVADGECVWNVVLASPSGDDAQEAAARGTWLGFMFHVEMDALLLAHSCGALIAFSPAAYAATSGVHAPTAGAQDVVEDAEGDADSDSDAALTVFKQLLTFPAGLMAMEWAPDQSVGAVVTCDRRIAVLTSSCHILAEVTESALLEFAPPSNLHEARALALAWRGDGSHFVLNCVDAASGVRCLRFYSQDAVCAAVGRNEDGSPVHGLYVVRTFTRARVHTHARPHTHTPTCVCLLVRERLSLAQPPDSQGGAAPPTPTCVNVRLCAHARARCHTTTLPRLPSATLPHSTCAGTRAWHGHQTARLWLRGRTCRSSAACRSPSLSRMDCATASWCCPAARPAPQAHASLLCSGIWSLHCSLCWCSMQARLLMCSCGVAAIITGTASAFTQRHHCRSQPTRTPHPC